MVGHHPARAHAQPLLALMIEVPEPSSRSKPGNPSMWHACELTLVNCTYSAEKLPDPPGALADTCPRPDTCNRLAEHVGLGGGGTGNENFPPAWPSGPPFG